MVFQWMMIKVRDLILSRVIMNARVIRITYGCTCFEC